MTPSKKTGVETTANDRERLADLYDRTFARVYNAIRYRVDDDCAAEDLTVQVYERALASLARYQPEAGPLDGWLFGIARHVAADYLRRRRFTAWLPWESFLRRPCPDPPPEEAVLRRELEASLAGALKSLKDRERDLLGLKYGAGLTNRAIAGLTGLSEQNVALIVFRVLTRLRALLGNEALGASLPLDEEEVERV